MLLAEKSIKYIHNGGTVMTCVEEALLAVVKILLNNKQDVSDCYKLSKDERALLTDIASAEDVFQEKTKILDMSIFFYLGIGMDGISSLFEGANLLAQSVLDKIERTERVFCRWESSLYNVLSGRKDLAILDVPENGSELQAYVEMFVGELCGLLSIFHNIWKLAVDDRDKSGLYDRIIDFAGIDGDDIFIDIGCGTGELLLTASERGQRSLVGVDMSPYCIESSYRRLGNGSICCPETEFVFDNTGLILNGALISSSTLSELDSDKPLLLADNLRYLGKLKQVLSEYGKLAGTVILVSPGAWEPYVSCKLLKHILTEGREAQTQLAMMASQLPDILKNGGSLVLALPLWHLEPVNVGTICAFVVTHLSIYNSLLVGAELIIDEIKVMAMHDGERYSIVRILSEASFTEGAYSEKIYGDKKYILLKMKMCKR